MQDYHSLASSRQSLTEGLSYSRTYTLILQVPDVEVLVLYRRLGLETELTVKAGNFISTAKSSSAFTCIGYSIYMHGIGAEAALGSAPERNGHDPLLLMLFFSLRTCRSSCTSIKSSTSF